MEKIEKFKNFAKQNPSLLNYVNNKKMTWQKFYEMYDMYGENEDIWKPYLKVQNEISSFDLINWFKNIDIDSLQENINSIKRVIGVFEDLKTNNKHSEYQPRPLYRHFED